MLFPAAMAALCCSTVAFSFPSAACPSVFFPQFVLSSCLWAALHVLPPFPFDSFVNSSRFSPPPLNGRPLRLPLWMPPAFLVYLQCVCVTESPAHCGRRDAVALQRDERSVMQSDRQHSCSPGSLTSGTAANSMHIK